MGLKVGGQVVAIFRETLQTSDRIPIGSRKLPTEVVMGGQNFNFPLTFFKICVSALNGGVVHIWLLVWVETKLQGALFYLVGTGGF